MSFINRFARWRFTRWWTRSTPSSETPLEQACAIPYRIVEGEPEFCLITSTRTGRWGFPKGIIDPGETAEEAAVREAHEEAGVRGGIVGPPLGAYFDEKWGTKLHVTVFLMEVDRVDAHWSEESARKRRLCNAEEARELLAKSRQRETFAQALQRLRLVR
jgi:8-oxo-dGTP pyrophosphatase MutT (NUDIX family)